MREYCLFNTALGHCGIAWQGDAVLATRLPDPDMARMRESFEQRANASEGQPPLAILHAIELITRLFEGEKPDLSDVRCSFVDTAPFDRKVYAIARKVPPGETSTYGAIARAIGDMRQARRVGQALGRNPLPVIVPCHRIIGGNGKLVGFSAAGGVETKLRLLEIERAPITGAPGLFGDLPLAIRPRR